MKAWGRGYCNLLVESPPGQGHFGIVQRSHQSVRPQVTPGQNPLVQHNTNKASNSEQIPHVSLTGRADILHCEVGENFRISATRAAIGVLTVETRQTNKQTNKKQTNRHSNKGGGFGLGISYRNCAFFANS